MQFRMGALAASAALAFGVVSVVSAGLVTTQKAARAQDKAQDKTAGMSEDELYKDIEDEVARNVRQCTSYIAVGRGGKNFRVVGKVKDASKETDYLVEGELINWWMKTPTGKEAAGMKPPIGKETTVYFTGVGPKANGAAADFRGQKVMPNFIDDNGAAHPNRLEWFVAPRKLSPNTDFFVTGTGHPSERVRTPIRAKDAK